MKKFVIFFLIFISLFGPKLNFNNLDIYSIGNIIVILFFFKHSLKKKYLLLYLWIFIFTLYVTLVLFINQIFDSEWLFKGPRLIINLFAVCSLCEYVIYKYGINTLIKFVFISCLSHGIIILLQIFIPEFNYFIINTFSRQDVDLDTIQTEVIRFSGLSRSYSISTLILVFGTFYIFFFTSSKLLFFLLLIILFPAIFVGSRTASSLSIISLFLFYIFNSRKVIQLIFRSFGVILLFLIIFNSVELIKLLPDSNFRSSLSYGTEAIALISEDSSGSSSLDDFLGHKLIVLNNSAFEHFFGTGNFGRISGKKIPTDIGYVLQYNGIGIFGILLCFVPYLYFISFVNFKKYRLFLYLFYFVVLILNYKESIVLSRGLFSFQIYLLLIGIRYLPKLEKL